MEINYLDTDMFKFKSLQKEESRVQSADSLEAYSKPRAYNGLKLICWWNNFAESVNLLTS